ncbi:D-inositol-3-phosphate glycosyltransferase [Paraburkholderia hiiakae]|uniref:D-inositol-3-phosphate glycosyltransferase n=1 Tax=Paraburkholderia hiiakae TaxID=1081782 RepID=A0ABM8P954_9BURK|nr:glycosyltransferase [Paraburkholderia hiiakae]CAD6559632.1 D-inositol-3-phosphate glycosyltransferase [Paraburkholderia hiiakae]
MNVLLVCDAIDPALGGGTAERTFQMALALRAAGVQCALIATSTALGERRRAELRGFDTLLPRSLSKRFFVPLVSPLKIATMIRRADIVHITGHWSWLGALVGTLARYYKKPYVYCPAGSLPVYGRSALIKRLYNRICGNRLVRHAACCMAIVELERAHFHAYGVGDERIALLANGVSTQVPDGLDAQRARTRYGIGNAPLLLFLGRLNVIKGPDLLVEAFGALAARHPHARLLLAGPDAGLGDSLAKRIAKLGLQERIQFTGHLEVREKFELLQASDLLVIPSRQEMMSLVVLEAGLVGTPALLTDQCGFDDVERIDGGRVVAANASALAVALDELLSTSETLPVMGARLQQFVVHNYTWDSLIRECVALYARLLDGALPGRSTQEH